MGEMEFDLAEEFDLKRRKTELQMAHLEPKKQQKQAIKHESQDTMTSNLNDINLSDNPLSYEKNKMNQILSIDNSTKLLLASDTQRSALSDISMNDMANLPDDEFPNLPDDEGSIELKIKSDAELISNTHYKQMI